MPLRFSSVVLNALSVADVLCDEAPPAEPSWPPSNARIDAGRAGALLAHFDGDEPIEPAVTATEKRAFAAYAAARARWLATPSSRAGRVPSFKFQSNAGWIVSADEARTISAALRELLADDAQFELLCDVLDVSRAGTKSVREALQTFQRFNDRRAKADGYTVD